MRTHDGGGGAEDDTGVIREWPRRSIPPRRGVVHRIIQPTPVPKRPQNEAPALVTPETPSLVTTTEGELSDLELLVRGDPEAIKRLIAEARASHHQNPFGLNEPQVRAVELLCGNQRHTLLVGGSRSAKTTLICRHILMRAIKGQRMGAGGRHAILRHRFNAVKSSVWRQTFPKMLRLFFRGPDGRCAVKMRPNWQDGFVRVWAAQKEEPAEIWFGGLDDQERVEKILGNEYATIFFNECSQIARSSAMVALTRLAEVLRGKDPVTGQPVELVQKALYDLNPVGKGHWTYQLFFDKVDPDTRRPLIDPNNYQTMFLNPLDNAENLTEEYLKELMGYPEKMRRRFFSGEYVAELSNALWAFALLEQLRVDLDEKPSSKRVCIAIDPSGCEGQEDKRSDEIGLVAAERAMDDHAYVLDDQSGWYSPEEWAQKALLMRDRWQADIIVAERNFGGDMVAAVIRTKDRNAKVKLVTASRGKHVRAEPVAALYDQKRVHHCGRFDALEEQMTNFTTAGYEGPKSPDRADALVWALTELMLGGQGDTGWATPKGTY